MRLSSFVFVVVTGVFTAVLGGCGGDSSDNDGGADLNVFSEASTGQACFAIAECAFSCASTDAACVQSCIAKGAPNAQAAYQTLTMCGYTECTGQGDGGAPNEGDFGVTTCTSMTDTSPACEQCLQNKIQSPPCAQLLNACTTS